MSRQLPDPVEIDESFSMIRWPDSRRGPWGIRANWVNIGGRPECVGLVIWHGADQGHHSPMQYYPHGKGTLRPITATGIAELPIATIIDKLRQAARDHWRENAAAIERLFPHWPEDDPRRVPNSSFEAPKKGRPGAPARYDREHFVAVAKAYLLAWEETGNAPTQAVADKFGVSRSAAAKWISKCRTPELGLLSPAPVHGRPGAEPGPNLRNANRTTREQQS